MSFTLIICALYAKNYSSKYKYNISIYIPKTLATNFHKTETIRDVRRDSNKLIKWDSNTPLSIQERSDEKQYETLEDITNLFNKESVCKTENPNKKYAFFSRVHETLMKTNHILSHK